MKKRNKEVEKKYLSEHPFINELWTKQAERYLKCNPALASANLLIRHQQKVINRLSRKIQRLKRISFRDKEITLILYCIDLIIQNYGENRELEKIYTRLYLQRKEHIENEKKSF